MVLIIQELFLSGSFSQSFFCLSEFILQFFLSLFSLISILLAIREDLWSLAFLENSFEEEETKEQKSK